MTTLVLAYPHIIIKYGITQKQPLVCRIVVGDKPCGKDPVRFYKHLKAGTYLGFCEKHGNLYPEGWSAFKPVSSEEIITHEIMET